MLQINTRTEHIRFRYMHMNPSNLDADGILNGRLVTEGEKICSWMQGGGSFKGSR